MDNPFLRRATEYLRDDEAFLAVVSPEPVTHYLRKHGETGILYDRLVLIRGTPGSGKTTLARLFEYPTLNALLRNQSFTGYKDLHAAMSACKAVDGEEARVLACRIPMESDYRDFWEFPYSTEVKTNLMATLLQARTVLAWFRHLKSIGISSNQVELVTRPESQGILDTIGGTAGESVFQRAADVENRLYKVITSLVPPTEAVLAVEMAVPYRPFDHIERIRILAHPFGGAAIRDLVPLAIFDDAHVLHPEQFQSMERFLVRRELRIGRWIIARFDVLLPEQALAEAIDDRSDLIEHPGVTSERDTVLILLQSSGRRVEQRKRFRTLAKDMASRYLRRMPLFSEKGLTVLGNLLIEQGAGVSPGKLRELESKVDTTQSQLRITSTQRDIFEKQIREFWGEKSVLTQDVALSMLLVMMHRYHIRRGESDPNLFGNENEPVEQSIPVAANSAVYEAALFQLFHNYDRPYYFGIDDVCDASSENAEQFLRLSAELVETVVTQLARSKSPSLSPVIQSKLLRETGNQIIEKWNFPQDTVVRKLVNSIAELCLKKSSEPNGAVIANAYGILQSEFDTLAKTLPEVARGLQFAVAYNAISLVPHHSCKNKVWCLLELGGVALLSYGLTLKRGGFIEGTAAKLKSFIAEEQL